KLSVVAPISASYPALTTMLAVASGERLTGSRLGGIVLTIAGVVSVAMGEEGGGNSKAEGVAEREAGRGSDTGISWALLAAGGFGVLFWVLGVRVVPHTGPYATVWMIRLTSTIVTGAALLGQGKRIVAPTGPLGWQVLGMGVLDTGAFLMNNRGLQIEQVSVVTVLSSLYSAVTIALAAAMLREHLRRVQWVGVAVIFAGIYLISR
ncbi:MAG TPA: DMT family transporter, partial [Methylomirabilota bacterium]|nr:DMT family transporter [Methylomirabilota bacterium]